MDDTDNRGGMRLQLESRTREDFRRITAKAERSARMENGLWLGVLSLSSMCMGALALWAFASTSGVCL